VVLLPAAERDTALHHVVVRGGDPHSTTHLASALRRAGTSVLIPALQPLEQRLLPQLLLECRHPSTQLRARRQLHPGGTRARGTSLPPPPGAAWPPIDAPCTQCLRHGDPIHASKGRRGRGGADLAEAAWPSGVVASRDSAAALVPLLALAPRGSERRSIDPAPPPAAARGGGGGDRLSSRRRTACAVQQGLGESATPSDFLSGGRLRRSTRCCSAGEETTSEHLSRSFTLLAFEASQPPMAATKISRQSPTAHGHQTLTWGGGGGGEGAAERHTTRGSLAAAPAPCVAPPPHPSSGRSPPARTRARSAPAHGARTQRPGASGGASGGAGAAGSGYLATCLSPPPPPLLPWRPPGGPPGGPPRSGGGGRGGRASAPSGPSTVTRRWGWGAAGR
jgi:hypothetical protein